MVGAVRRPDGPQAPGPGVDPRPPRRRPRPAPGRRCASSSRRRAAIGFVAFSFWLIIIAGPGRVARTRLVVGLFDYYKQFEALSRGGGQRRQARRGRRAPPPRARPRRAARPVGARPGPSTRRRRSSTRSPSPRGAACTATSTATPRSCAPSSPTCHGVPRRARRRRRRRRAAAERGRAGAARAGRRARHAVAVLSALSADGAPRARPRRAGRRLRRRRAAQRGQRAHADRRAVQPERPDRRAAADATRSRRLLEALPERVVVLLDEALRDYVDPAAEARDAALELGEEHPRLLVFRTFSKAWGLAGLRVRLRDRRPGRGAAARAPGARARPQRARAGRRAGGAAHAPPTSRERRGAAIVGRARASCSPRCASGPSSSRPPRPTCCGSARPGCRGAELAARLARGRRDRRRRRPRSGDPDRVRVAVPHRPELRERLLRALDGALGLVER